jgi:hypothetical protein
MNTSKFRQRNAAGTTVTEHYAKQFFLRIAEQFGVLVAAALAAPKQAVAAVLLGSS